MDIPAPENAVFIWKQGFGSYGECHLRLVMGNSTLEQSIILISCPKTPMSSIPKEADKLNLSLCPKRPLNLITHSLLIFWINWNTNH